MYNTNFSPNQDNSDADSSMSSLWALNKKDYEDRIAFLQEQNIKIQHQNIQLKLSEQQYKSLYQIQLEQNNVKQKKIHYFKNKVDRLINQICILKSKLNRLSTEYDTLIASSQSLTDDQKRKGSSEYITKEILCQRDESSIFGDIMDESMMMRQNNNNLSVQNRRSQRVININNDNKQPKLNRQIRSEQQKNPRQKNVNTILTNQFLALIGQVKEVNSILNDDKQQKQKQLVKKQVKEQQIHIFPSKVTINKEEKIQQANKQPQQIFVKLEEKLVINDDNNPLVNIIQQNNVDEPLLLEPNRNQQIQQQKINNKKQQNPSQINNQPTATIQATIQLTKNQVVNQQRQQKIQECQLSECCDTTIQQIHQHLSQQVELIPVPGYDAFVEGLQPQQQPQQPQQEIRHEQINHKDLAKALLSEVEKIGKNIVRKDVPKILGGLFRKKR